MSRPAGRAAWRILGLGLGIAACDRLLVEPAAGPAGVALDLAPAANQALAAMGSREAFNAADSIRIVLLDGAQFTGDPFSPAGRFLDVTLPFAPADTVRVSLELDDATTPPGDVVLGVMLKEHGQALFVYADSIVLTSGQTTRVPVPILVPVPAAISLHTAKDSLLLPADSTRVHAVGLFATGDTIPDSQFFPDFVAVDGNLAVNDDGTSALVRPGSVAGSWRLVGRVSGIGSDPADTVLIRVVSPPPVAARFFEVTTGGSFSCGLATDLTVYCWGYNGWGTLGTGNTNDSPIPVQAVGGQQFQSISAGQDHVCGILTTGGMVCWGRNDSGQLGTGAITPSEPGGAAVLGGPWTMVAAGGDHTCALDATGGVYCWGANHYGQLGAGTALGSNSPTPFHVGTETWNYVSVGAHVSCAVQASGTAKCWGAGSTGILGNGGTSDQSLPTLVSGGPWVKIRLGFQHACGIATSGQIYCWGLNNYNQMGLAAADFTMHPTPELTSLQVAVTSLDAGTFYTCLVRASDGTYKCWGDNSVGQLGEGVPPGPGWAQIDAPVIQAHTCAVRQDLQTYCWGHNAFGQLGNGSTTSSNVPVPVSDPGTAAAASTGGTR